MNALPQNNHELQKGFQDVTGKPTALHPIPSSANSNQATENLDVNSGSIFRTTEK